MDTSTMTIRGLRRHLIEKAATDEAFRAGLLSDPNAAIEEELGVTIPAGFTINVHEDTEDTGHLVLPPSAVLDEAELAQVTGGRNEHSGGWSLGPG